MIEQAFSLEEDMEALIDDYSGDWSFEKCHVDRPTVVVGYVYIFQHFLVALQYASLISKRIILQDIMTKAYYSQPDPDSLFLPATALFHVYNGSETTRQLQLDVLAVIPQLLEQPFTQRAPTSTLPTSPPCDVAKDHMWTNFGVKDQNPWRFSTEQKLHLPNTRCGLGHRMQWPLYTVGLYAVDDEIKSWVIDIMRSLGHRMGLQQTFLLVSLLESGAGD